MMKHLVKFHFLPQILLFPTFNHMPYTKSKKINRLLDNYANQREITLRYVHVIDITIRFKLRHRKYNFKIRFNIKTFCLFFYLK